MGAKQHARQVNAKVSDHNQGRSVWSAVLGETVKSGGDDKADWSEVDRELLVWLVQTVSRHEGAVLLGVSRDGSQFHVKIYGGNQQKNFWFAGSEGGLALLHEWITAFCQGLDALE